MIEMFGSLRFREVSTQHGRLCRSYLLSKWYLEESAVWSRTLMSGVRSVESNSHARSSQQRPSLPAARSLRLRIYLFVCLFIFSFTCISSSSGDQSNTSTSVSLSRGVLRPEVVGCYLNENDVLAAERPRPVCVTWCVWVPGQVSWRFRSSVEWADFVGRKIKYML